MTIQSQLDQVLALAEKATPGPWWLHAEYSTIYVEGKCSDPRLTQEVAAVGAKEGGKEQQATDAELLVSAVNFLREHGPAIHAAVGGEAVAWAHPNTLKLLDRCRNDEYNGTVEVWVRAHPESGVTRPLYASPPATVSVEALRELVPDRRSQEVSGDGLPNCCAAEWNRCRAEVERRIAALIGKGA